MDYEYLRKMLKQFDRGIITGDEFYNLTGMTVKQACEVLVPKD